MLKKIRNQHFLFPSNKTMKKNERRTLNALTVMPNLALEFEFPATGCTYAGVWSALTAYMCTVIPQENLATMQGILHGVYWGLGSGCGSLFGGILIQRLGAPTTFWIFAAASGVNLVIFVVAQKVCVFLLFQRFYITIFLQISEYIENMSAKSIKKNQIPSQDYQYCSGARISYFPTKSSPISFQQLSRQQLCMELLKMNTALIL